MRSFVALNLPEAVRREAGRRMSAHKGRLPHARWTHPDNLHLTLVFLGEVGEAAQTDLDAALTRAFAAHAPLTLRLAGAGTFPPPPARGGEDGGSDRRSQDQRRRRDRRRRRSPGGRPARVAWVGVGVAEGVGRLLALQRDVDRACRSVLDLAPAGGPYAPHLTLARPKEPWRRRAMEDFIAAFREPMGEPFRADAGHLVRSELGAGPGGGSLYTPVARYPLLGDAPAGPSPEGGAEGEAGGGG